MYPLDVVKTRAQLAVGKVGGPNLFSTLLSMVRNDGFGIYRGILPPILVEAPKRAVKFASNERYQPLFRGADGKLSLTGAIGAGVSAGITEAFIVVPFELVKIRLQAKENAGLYKNTWDCLLKVVRSEGLLALYKGFEPTLWRHATWNGGYFGVIDYLRKITPDAKSEQGKKFRSFVIGALAGTFGTMLNTPPDVVKSRIQNQDAVLAKGVPRKYHWTVPSMATILREEGFAALYKGFVPKVLRLGPGGGILLVVFDFVMKLLEPYQ